ncbi:hypothetical protein [Planctomicrobium sp. SH664]|uniref:hypothetical protein n=1 Tax=Planctomicrobium sp. SH664 TaxID=3448125 RepID=UPI003F5B4B64
MPRFFSLAGLLGLMAAVSVAADAAKLDDIKCPVSGKPVVSEHSAKYLDGKVYFCCPNCPKGFAANTEKFTEKANEQLVLTGQYVAKACPFSGKPIAETAGEKKEIGFCCKNCLSKYEKASKEERLKLVYGKAPFEKGFEKKKETKATGS